MNMKPALLATLLFASQAAETEPGLVAEYFALDRAPEGFPDVPAGRKPTFVRVEPVIDRRADDPVSIEPPCGERSAGHGTRSGAQPAESLAE